MKGVVSHEDLLNKLDAILYTRPAGQSIIGFAIKEIDHLRAENAALREALRLVLVNAYNPEIVTEISESAFSAPAGAGREEL